MRVLVTGATGFVGQALVSKLVREHDVVATTRKPDHANPGTAVSRLTYVHWDAASPLSVSGKLDAIVHLAGEPVIGKRWTRKQRQRLRDSRIESAKHISNWVSQQPARDRPVVVSANAVGYYGVLPKGPCPESRGPGDDFLATLCVDWQQAVATTPTRTVVFRFGHILGDGGYLGSLLPFAKFHLGGPIAGGKQPMAWVHIDDVVDAITWAIATPKAKGVYNLVSPAAAGTTQKEFAHALAAALDKPFQVPVPAFGLGLRFGFDVATVLTGGEDAVPQRLVEDGFSFSHQDLPRALRSIVATM